jgi:parallel beta-helix repeat protein
MKKLITIAVILLLIGLAFAPSINANIQSDLVEKSTISFDDKTLYVGGSGEGNYSNIQDAIDDSSDGDTVFVYSGTYIGILKVNKTINLIGEDRDNTIIDANRETDAIYIYVPNVKIINFRIQNAFRAGINLDSNTTDNINISKNIFCFNGHGIHPYFSNKNLIISNNIFTNNNNGFTLVCSSNAIIYQNQFINNSLWGMGFYMSSNCDVFHNNIIDGKKYGIFLYGLSHSNYFHHNNFINNSMNAYFILLSHRNKWNENFWEKQLTYPYPIIGSLGILIPCWLNFDWHPAKEPYDI